MYKYPENARNYAGTPHPDLIASLEGQIDWFDHDKYLADGTREVCDIIMEGRQVDLTTILPGWEQPHTQMYLYLRHELREYERRGYGEIRELQSPRGAMELIREIQDDMEAQVREAEAEVLRERGYIRVIGDEVEEDDDGTDEEDDDGIFFEP